MRLIKTLGLAAVATMAAMAFVGTTSASAADTQLCTAHTTLICGGGTAAFFVEMLGSGRLLSDLTDVICDHIHEEGPLLKLNNPQQVHVTHLLFNSCETDDYDGCEVSVLTLPLFTLSKTGLDTGTLTGTNGLTLVECEDVLFSTDIHCIYDTTGLQFSVGAQHLTANNTQIDYVGGDLCPAEAFLDGLLTTDADPLQPDNSYILA